MYIYIYIYIRIARERVTTTSASTTCTLGLSSTTVGGPPAADRRARVSQRAKILKSLVVVTLSGKPKIKYLCISSRNGTPWHARKADRQMSNMLVSPHQPILAQKLIHMLNFRGRSCSTVDEKCRSVMRRGERTMLINCCLTFLESTEPTCCLTSVHTFNFGRKVDQLLTNSYFSPQDKLLSSC